MIYSIIRSDKLRLAGHPRGFVDIIVVLPLFLVSLWAMSLLAFVLTYRTIAEQHAWSYGTIRASRVEKKHAKSAIDLHHNQPPLLASLDIRETNKCKENAWILPTLNSKASLVFQAYVSKACPKEATVTMKSKNHRLWDNLNSLTASHSFKLFSSVQSQTLLPGTSLKGNHSFKQALWLEAMAQAGFTGLPLQLLAVPELMSIAGIVHVSVP